MKQYTFEEIGSGVVFKQKYTELTDYYFFYKKVSGLYYKDLLYNGIFKIGWNGGLASVNINNLVQETFTIASRSEIKEEYDYAKLRGYLCR